MSHPQEKKKKKNMIKKIFFKKEEKTDYIKSRVNIMFPHVDSPGRSTASSNFSLAPSLIKKRKKIKITKKGLILDFPLLRMIKDFVFNLP